jgi:TPR repeat protein
MTRLAAVAILLLLATLPARADFAAGAQAYDGGDYATAFAEWHRLAKAGDVMAQTAIASMFRTGAGRTPDPRGAFNWYRRAAQAGDAIAQMNLGEMLALGQGTPRDYIEAWVWLTRAAAQGNGWAKDEAARIEQLMTPEQVGDARRRTSIRVAP